MVIRLLKRERETERGFLSNVIVQQLNQCLQTRLMVENNSAIIMLASVIPLYSNIFLINE